jgi:putative transposase
MSLPLSTRRNWVEVSPDYSIRRQCRLAGVSRSCVYYEPVVETEENLILMRLIDEQYLRHPEFGYP